MTAGAKDEFRNTTTGFVGVITIDNGKERGVAVRPGGTIWLSEDEQILTANAPRKDEDNPFANGSLDLITSAENVVNRRPIGGAQTNGATAVAEAPPASEAVAEPEAPPASSGNTAPKPQTTREVADAERAKQEAAKQAAAKKQAEAGVTPAEETGSAVAPSGTPKVGKRAATEEVATPEAPAAG
jgi:hypothetical protein